MICKTCGREIADDAKFCGSCGAVVAIPEAETANDAPTEEIADYGYAQTPVYDNAGETQVLSENPLVNSQQAPTMTAQQYDYSQAYQYNQNYQTAEPSQVYQPAQPYQSAEQYQQPMGQYQQVPGQYQSAQPYQPYQPTAPAFSEPKVRKGKFVKSVATKGVKTASLLSRIAGLLCIVVCVAIFGQFVCGSVFDLPILEYAGVDVGVDKDFIDDEFNRADAAYKRVKAEHKALSDEIKNAPDSDEKKELEKRLETVGEELAFADELLFCAEDLVDTPSIYNVYMMVKHFETIPEKFDYDMDDVDEVADAIIYGTLIFGAVVLFAIFLTLLAMLLRNNVFTVAALIFAGLFALFFAGVLYVALAVVAYVALFATQFVVNRAYKKYRRS